jgi:uncharacterized membrane protein YphA (DoxX/SURF4 family)
MSMSAAVARPLLAGVFIYGGLDALRDPESKAKAADDVAPMIAGALHLPTTDTVTLVRINGGIQTVAGTMLALGKFRRFSALLLAGSLVPTTYAGHRFWEEIDEDRRAQQRIQFMKNAAMLGGLAFAATDTGGRPSVPWQARRAARHAVEATVAAGAAAQGTASQLLGASGGAKDAAGGAVDFARNAAHGVAAYSAKVPDVAELKELSFRARDTAVAEGADIGKRVRKAATKAQKKALKSPLTKRAIKAARRAAKQAQKAEFTKQAVRAAKQARDALPIAS